MIENVKIMIMTALKSKFYRYFVLRRMFSTPGGYHECSGGYYEDTGGGGRGEEGVFSTLGDIMSTPGRYYDKCGGRSLEDK